MKSINNSNIQTLAATAFCLFSCCATLGQIDPRQIAESKMPDECQLEYHVRVKICQSEAEQRKEYEKEAAYARELHAKDKTVIVPDPFPGVAPDREFGIKIAQDRGSFYWASDDKHNPLNFIYDGKRTYFYDQTSHRMYVHGGFKLTNGVTLPLPGRGFSFLPLIVHASGSIPGKIDGEVYVNNVDDQGKPSYMPGWIELNASDPTRVERAVAYNGTKKYHEYLFPQYSMLEGLAVPTEIIENLYNLQTTQKTDIVFLESKFHLVSSSLSSPRQAMFDPINLLKHEEADGSDSPEFVQWYYDDGREITFTYKPGKSLEEQAGVKDYQLKKTANRIENGKIDPRNYVGLGLLCVLLAMVLWKVPSALKMRRNG